MGIHERRAREKAQRKELILNSARRLLLEQGLEGTSINRIAKMAELSPSALYTYYQNKEEIIVALTGEGLGLLVRLMEKRVPPSASPPDKLRLLAAAYWDFSRKHKEYHDLINYFLTSPRTMLPEDMKRAVHGEEVEKALNFGLVAVAEGVASCRFHPVDGRRFILMFWAALNGVIQLEKLRDTTLGNVDHEDLYLYTVEQLIGTIDAGPEAQT